MLDFPDNPTDGQTHIEAGQVWRWDGAAGVWFVGGKSGAVTEITEGGIVSPETQHNSYWFVIGDWLIQGGTDGTQSGTAAYAQVDFPVAFKSGTIPAVAHTVKAGTSPIYTVTTHTPTATYFRWRSYNASGTATGSYYAGWMAIGEAPDALKKPKEVIAGSSNAGAIQIVDDSPQHVVVGNTLIQWGTFGTDASGNGQIIYPFAYKELPTTLVSAYWGAANVNTTFITTGDTLTGTEVRAVDNFTGDPLAFGTNGRWIATGVAPDDMVMPTEIEIIGVDARDYMTKDDIVLNYLDKVTTTPQVVEATVNFKNNLGVGEDIYLDRVTGKNESGVIFLRDNAQSAGYLFWDEAGNRFLFNTYDSDGSYLSSPLEIVPGGTVSINKPLRLTENTITVDEYTGVNSHVYFSHNGIQHALFYSTPASDAGLLNVNQYNNSGAWLSQGRFYTSGGMSRVEFGDVVCTGGKYYGPGSNFGVILQNDNGGPVSFGDIGFHRLVGGGGGPVGVYLEVANNNNVSNWGIHCDFTSDIATKDAVQPSMVDALKDIGELLPIRWIYNDKAPRIGTFKAAEPMKERVEREFIDKVDVVAGPVEGEYVIDDVEQAVELGFSSEDIKRIAPGAVYEVAGVERIDYRQVVPHCLRAIQQLTERIQELEDKLP